MGDRVTKPAALLDEVCEGGASCLHCLIRQDRRLLMHPGRVQVLPSGDRSRVVQQARVPAIDLEPVGERVEPVAVVHDPLEGAGLHEEPAAEGHGVACHVQGPPCEGQVVGRVSFGGREVRRRLMEDDPLHCCRGE